MLDPVVDPVVQRGRQRAADYAYKLEVRRRHRADSIARITTRIRAGDLDELPDVFLMVLELAMDRQMAEIGRYARCPGYLFVSPHAGELSND